jgi:tetratricopeptide (TPR) repeat protein
MISPSFIRKSLTFALVLLAIYVTGCAKNKPAISNLPEKDSNALAAQQSKFEKAKDPPFTANTHFAAGQLAESQEAHLAAVHHYQAALKLDKHHQPSLFRTAIIQTKLKDFPNAIATWKRYLKETNNDATAYGNLGFCYELAGKKSEAEKTWLDGIAKEPTNASCRVNYGLFLARSGRVAEARDQFKAVLTGAQAHYNLGSIFEQQGKKEEARTEFRQALQLDANMTDARARLAALD